MMKNTFLTSCCLIVFATIFNVGLQANNGDENFCYNADVPEAQDNLAAMCLTAPTLFCPATYLGCPSDDLDPSITGFPTALPGDANCPNPVVTYTDQVVSNTPCLKIVHRTWEATYPPGSASIKLHSTCQQTLYLEDTGLPVINDCPSDIIIDLSTNCDSTATWVVPTASDDCGIQLFVTTHYSGSTFPSGTTPVTYTANDHCGNMETCNFTVTVTGSCCSAPAITCPAEVTVCPTAGTTPSQTGVASATASDPSCGTPIVTFVDVITSTGPCAGQQEIQRTWTASDGSNNSLVSSCVQLIHVIDNTNPVISNTPSNISVNGNGNNCQVAVTWAAPTATDDCNVASLTSSHSSGNTFAEGTHTVTYTAVDDCGNTATSSFTVTVNCICNSAPILTCPTNYVACPSSPSISPSITGTATAVAGDPSCGTPALTYSDVVLSTGPCAGAQAIQRTWTATVINNNSLTTECVQLVTIADTSTPTITNLPQDITVTGTGANCSVPATWNEPTATDDCGVTSFTSTHTSGASFTSGTTTVMYTAVDACGNATSQAFTVTVNCALCTSPPILTCPVDYTGCPFNGYPTPSLTGVATATISGANCTGTPIVSYNDIVNSQGSCSNAYNITRLWTATDPNDSSLTVSCNQSIVVTDNGGPSITSIPSDITVHATGPTCAVPVKWGAVEATDDCGVASVNTTHDNGSTFPEGTTTVIYTVADNCGNTTVGSFNVTVECSGCNTAPNITCPTNYISCPGGMLPSPSIAGVASASASSTGCTTPFVFYSDFISGFGSCTGSYAANRTWTAFDPSSGLTSSCVQVIDMTDNGTPIITNMPQDITLSGTGGGCQLVANWNTPTATDNCGIASLTSDHNSGASFSEGTTTVTYTAVDNCGNSTSQTFTVTVECSGCGTPPSITCPSNYVLCPGSNFPSPSVSGVATAVAGSSDCGTPVVTYNDVMVSFGNCAGAMTYQRNWIATDPNEAGVFSTCAQTITLEDTTQPVVSNVPANITVTGNGVNCQVPVTWNTPTATDDCGIGQISSNYQSGHTFSEGTTTVTFTITDNCNNTVSASFTVTVNCVACSTPPAITCPANYTACTSSSTSPSITGVATATHGNANCNGNLTVTYNDVVTSTGPCAGAQVIQRTWTAADANTGLTSSCTQTITLVDNNAPVITNVPSNISISGSGNGCQMPVTWTIPTATDACGSVTFTSNINSGSTFAEGITTVTYTATDMCGNVSTAAFTVTVDCGVCNTPPAITCPSDFQTCATGNGIPNPLIAGFAWSVINGPNCTGTPYMTYNDVVVSSGPCAGAMEIERTWIATDPSNKLQSNCVQHISLVDNSMPVISGMPANISVSGTGSNCTVPVTWAAPTATDDCGIASLVTSLQSGTSFSQGTTTVTYTATDDCGNVTTASFTVTVTCAGCNTPPVITCPANYTACPGSNISPSVTGIATAHNNGANCVGVPTVTYTDIVTPVAQCSGPEITERTWTATDPNTGLTATCVQLITLVDNTPPVISNMPSNIVVSGNGAGCSVPVTWTVPTATDNCDMSGEPLCDYVVGDYFSEGVTTVTYTATDACGNGTTASFTITVNCAGCSTPPSINCPANYTACPGSSTSPSITGVAAATNYGANCNGTPTVTYTDVVVSTGPCAGAQEIHRTWIATDPNTGLTSSCTQIIILQDVTGPTILNMPSNIVVNGMGSGCTVPVTWTVPTALDNCGIANAPTCAYTVGASFPEGTTTVTYTAVDDCGNTSTASFTVTVNCAGCNTPPSITCPASYTACPGTSTAPSVTGTATAINNGTDCNGTPVITYTDLIVSTGPCNGAKVIHRTWTATDPNTSLTATCTQTITLVDNVPPVIVNMPSNITVYGTGAGCTVPATWTVPTATDNCGISGAPTCAYTVGALFNEGTTTITYTATDNCGNTSVASFTVTVICAAVCDTPPTLSCPIDYTTCPHAAVPGPAIAGTATAYASGTICGAPVVTYSDLVISTGPCTGAQHIERTWTATDSNDPSLVTSCIQNIHLIDNTPPVLANCPVGLVIAGMTTTTGSGTGSGGGGGITIICTGVATWDAPTATDDCSNVSIVCTDQTGSIVNSGDTFEAGTTIVTCTATDLCGNASTCSFDIVVSCNEDCTDPPILSCPANTTVCIGANYSIGALGDVSVVTGPYCPAVEVTSEDILLSSGPCAGEFVYERVWMGSYPAIPGTTTSCSQVITIENTTPSFVGCPENIYVGDDQTPVLWTYPTLIDPCESASIVASHTSGSTFPCGTTTVTYTATDVCGNVIVCSFDVVVDCLSTSGFTYCPSNMTVSCSGGGAVANWSDPIYNNTCNDCAMGQNIPGFLYMGTYGGSQYYCSISPATWPVAKQMCDSHGGYLADINSAQENSFLANMLTIQSAWIGLTDVNSEGTFEWCNGQPVTYTNWHTGQPNNFNNNQDYCELLSTGEWNDQYNNYALEYIMEIPCNFVQQTAGPAPGSTLTGGTYIVTYGVSNGCNTNETCSFSITVEESLELTCPADITVTAPTGATAAVATWDAPVANSCCASCSSTIPGFVYMGSYNGHHYYCSATNDTWQNAKNNCAANGGYLASVNSAGENAFLAGIMSYQSAWVGGSDISTEGSFAWCDGSPFGYTNWYPGQPNNYNNSQHCIEFLSDGTWNDQHGHYLLEYIMEVPDCINITQTSGPTSGTSFTVGTTTTVSYSAMDGCGNTQTCSFNVTVEAGTGTQPCASGGTTSTYHYINSCTVGNMSNTSGDNGGYADFTNICETIEPGTVVPIQFCPGFGGAKPHVMYWSCWIDFNHDGDFNDNYEFVAYGAGSQCLNGQITIPSGLTNGYCTMRVSCKLGGYATDPCESYLYGETEDYCINIINGVTMADETGLTLRAAVIDDAVELFADVETTEEIEDTYEDEELVVVQADVEVSIYPNPVSSVMNVTLSDADQVVGIGLFDQTGQMVRELNSVQEEMSVDVSQLSSGMYLLRVRQSDNRIVTEKVIITR